MVNLGELNIQGIYLGDTEIVSAYLGETQVYTNSTIPNYLKFEALEDNSTVTYIPSTVSTAEYSTDGINWQSFDNETVTLEYTGDIIYVKGTISGDQSGTDYAHFEMTGQIAAIGSIMSLYNENPKDKEILYDYEFLRLFQSCSSLVHTSKLKLPATILKKGSYEAMFRYCSALIDTPKLPATTLADSCYAQMFNGCSALIVTPKLPATTLVNNCYNALFRDCSSLTTAPELPATTLVNQCYQSMFYGCSALTEAPKLPATTLVNNCYYYMFRGCTSLTEAPELPATELVDNCYVQMFYGCSALSKITTYVTEWNENNASNWVSGVAENGTFLNFGFAEIPTGVSGIPTGWTRVDKDIYLTFTAEEAGSTVKYNATTNTTAEYSTDGGTTWTNAVGVTVTLQNVGDKVNYRGVISGDLSTSSTTPRFTMTGKIGAGGSIMSMYNNNPDDTTITYNAAFRNMFLNCSSLTTPPELPATTLSGYCYDLMFEGCSSLEFAPELPATTLETWCYDHMFKGCSSLTEAPALPATVLPGQCYQEMFNGCTSLTESPVLPAITSIGFWSMAYMFSNCTSLNKVTSYATTWNTSYSTSWLYNVPVAGDFYNLGGATIPRGTSGIPTYWTEHTSLDA